MKKDLFIVGIDVSKEKLDVYFHSTGFHFIIANNTKGFSNLIEHLFANNDSTLANVFICFENTGKYSKPLSLFLQESNIKFHMGSALAIKKSLGLVRGKDDKVDSKRIALYAYEKKDSLPITHLPNYEIDQTKSLLTLREKLIKHRTSYKNGISDLKDCYKEGENELIRKVQKELIDNLTTKIETVEAKILQIIANNEAMNNNFNLMLTIKGVGKITAFYFIAYTENFKAFINSRQFACFCGIAPFPYSSGKMVGKSRVHIYGNRKMKSVLDLVAKSTIRYNGEFKIYYDRRVKELGKSKMSTINIIRNKIVARVFAVVNRGTPYVNIYKFAS